jgi:RHS repeat-associated protein
MTTLTLARPAQTNLQGEALRHVEAYLRNEQQRRQLHGAMGRLERVEEWGGGTFGYEHDVTGDLVAVHEANGLERHYYYDAYRRLTAVEHGDELTTRYGYDEQDRLESINNRGSVTRYRYDDAGRVTGVRHGQGDVSVYRYDEAGRVVLARTSQVTTCWRYDAAGRAAAIEQSLGGVTLQVGLCYDDEGRLATMCLPGSDRALLYTWDERGRPRTVAIEQDELVRFAYDDAAKKTIIEHGNGVTAQSVASALDGRLARLEVRHGHERLLERSMEYDDIGQIVSDGERHYTYDRLGRLISADTPGLRSAHTYEYDMMDNLLVHRGPNSNVRFACDKQGRLESAVDASGRRTCYAYDRWGRLIGKAGKGGEWDYRYDDGGNLLEVRREQVTFATFLYDHKGRLVWADVAGKVERYLYGDADELLAVTDAAGQPLRLLVRTPLGVHAEVQGALGVGEVLFRHGDERGTLRLVTDMAGAIRAGFAYECFGQPLPVDREQAHTAAACRIGPGFTGRDWYAAIGLYYFGARWYDPGLGRFLTPDSYTGAPDDMRLVNPLHGGREQAARRGQILGEWLKQPRVRNAMAFCCNDPIGHVDPNGHWSFGGVLLMLLGAIWTLPTTLFGILVEITCLVVEVIRWLVWLFSAGHVSWQTPGFDAAASGRLNAFALVFTGGWLGSFSGMLGITFGNVFFVYKEWETSPYIAALPDPIFPPAYKGKVSIPRQRMLYEHELRHTNQAGWFGPFYHFGLPLFGFYEWDVIVNGYRNAWTERDARAHAEP